MGAHTRYTRRWLDKRFVTRTDDGLYHAHQPIYGIDHPACEGGHRRRLARTLQILRVLARLDARTMLDVGGGEGYLAECAKRALGYDAISCDLSIEACRRAYELFGIDSAAVTSYALPFPDDAFDVVTCSEVLEHVEHPIETLAELHRVARTAVIVTTEECQLNREAIEANLFRRCGFPHFERNEFHPDDLVELFGENTSVRSQLVEADAEGIDDLRAWVLAATRADEMANGGVGVILVALTSDAAFDHDATPRASDDAILDVITSPLIAAEPLAATTRPDPLAGLAACAVCPDCRGALMRDPLRCNTCALTFPVEGGTADLTTETDAERDRTRQALAAWLPPERLALALGLRDELDLPLAGPRAAWDFTTSEGRRGWLPNADLKPPAEPRREGGGWEWDSTETPWLIGPGIGAAGDEIAACEITMRIHNPAFARDAGVGQIWWLTDEDTDFGAGRHVVFPILNDDEAHTYRVELRGQPGWPTDGHVVCLRFDPVNGPCEIELISFALVE